jgi:hypothetical protein
MKLNRVSFCFCAQEFDKFVAMVEQASELNVEASMKQNPWPPETFQRQLALRTEHVNDSL